MWLNISTSCNNNCHTCYWHLDKSNNESLMNIATMKNATLFYLKHAKPKLNSLNIQFFGGEPLLNFDVIPDYVKWLKYNAFNINLSIFTNGILLNRDRIDYFIENHITINISYDPNFEVFSSYKNLSYEKFLHVDNMINYAIEKNPYSIVPYLIIKEEFIDKLAESILIIINKGFKCISIARLAYEKWGTKEVNRLIEIFKCIKDKNSIRINVYPEMYFSCENCYPYNIMIYPNGDIYDICYMCGSVLYHMNYVAKEDLNVFYMGNIENTSKLRFDIKRKRNIFKQDYKEINSFCPTLSDNIDDIKFLID